MNGKKIVLLKLQNAGGAYIEVCNYGATSEFLTCKS
jgi:hypothetical protein